MINRTGSPVEGDDFYGREAELEFAWKQIKNGNSLVMSAPRRVGKTSFAKKMIVFAKKENWNTIELNLEEIKTEEAFVKLLIESLKKESWWQKLGFKTILESIKPSFEYEGVKTTLEYKSAKEDVYEKLKQLLEFNHDTLIVIDELTVLLNFLIKSENGKEKVEFYLNWLRSFRQKSGSKIRWIFCSSVGIENFTSMYNLSYTLNDVSPFPIGALNPNQALGLLKQLEKSENLHFTEEQNSHFLNKLGWTLPYFIQILFNNVHKLINIESKTISNETIDLAYQNLISEKHLNTWDERLEEYNEYQANARVILDYLSKTKIGEERDLLLMVLYEKLNDEEKARIILSKILKMLINDGYLTINENEKYTFRSPLLRDFWYNRFLR
jgi:uncharacterized protein